MELGPSPADAAFWKVGEEVWAQRRQRQKSIFSRSKDYFPQHLVCLVPLLTWEKEVELISAYAVAVSCFSK